MEWIRTTLFSIYSDAIYYLVKLSLSAPTNALGSKEVRQHFSEAQRFLNLLHCYHDPAGAAKELQERSRALAAASEQTVELATASEAALATVKALFQADGRVQTNAGT
ncbi:hypothetical protein [Piscinibacter koreensis]|uniref:Uncharacterized protein n=1 Tax=Piscinibacter koreensis TaxID=2742824 RepID=A0A7Y6NMN0_9BURK|nr:hypothetical protein [Schlegelella koreensis]NUZ05980.1 hypothetical protein [Schlegelella koreensis]